MRALSNSERDLKKKIVEERHMMLAICSQRSRVRTLASMRSRGSMRLLLTRQVPYPLPIPTTTRHCLSRRTPPARRQGNLIISRWGSDLILSKVELKTAGGMRTTLLMKRSRLQLLRLSCIMRRIGRVSYLKDQTLLINLRLWLQFHKEEIMLTLSQLGKTLKKRGK